MIMHTNILKSALLCASTEVVRYYMNSVYIDAEGFAVSTDGHRMFVAKIDLQGEQGGYIIPSDVLKRVLSGNRAEFIDMTASEIDGQRYTPVDGHFPDWRRVIPSDASGVAGQFNPDYVADFGKIGALLDCGKKGSLRAHIHHNGENATGVTFMGREDCFGVLMPMRGAHTNSAKGWTDQIKLVSPACQMAAE